MAKGFDERIVEVKDMGTVESVFYSTTSGEINDGSPDTQGMNCYPVIPAELKCYMDSVWREIPECYLYMAKIEEQLGMLVTGEFAGANYLEMLAKAQELRQIKELQGFAIYTGKHTGLHLLNVTEPNHELSMFMPIGTSWEKVCEVVVELKRLILKATEEEKAPKRLLEFEHQPADKEICPRCYKRTMKPNMATNALSRHLDGIYVCDACGIEEALYDCLEMLHPTEYGKAQDSASERMQY